MAEKRKRLPIYEVINKSWESRFISLPEKELIDSLGEGYVCLKLIPEIELHKRILAHFQSSEITNMEVEMIAGWYGSYGNFGCACPPEVIPDLIGEFQAKQKKIPEIFNIVSLALADLIYQQDENGKATTIANENDGVTMAWSPV